MKLNILLNIYYGYSNSIGTSALQIGHYYCAFNHPNKHFKWNLCWQGKLLAKINSSWHIMHISSS